MVGAVLAEGQVSLFVTGTVLGEGQVLLLWRVQYLVK